MVKKLDFTIGRLHDVTKKFVENANRICGPDAPFYEPPRDQSHIFAELEGLVQHAEDTLEDIRFELEASVEEQYREVLRQMEGG